MISWDREVYYLINGSAINTIPTNIWFIAKECGNDRNKRFEDNRC